MQPHWLPPGTQQRVRPSTEVAPIVSWRNLQKCKDKKSTQNSIPRDLFEKHKRDPSQEMEPPKSEFQKKLNLWTPFTNLLLVHSIDFDLSPEDYSSLGNLHAQVYVTNQEIAYPSDLDFSKAIDIKIIVDKVCPCLPIWDATKKEGFKLYYNEEMPSGRSRLKLSTIQGIVVPCLVGRSLLMLQMHMALEPSGIKLCGLIP